MSQNIEIEFKNMLTKEEYERFLLEFNIDKRQIFSQENHYFDTPDFTLKELGSALRIRKKLQSYEMTLKQPAAVGILETNQTLSYEEAEQAIHSGKLPAGLIQNLLKKENVLFSTIEYFGSLSTNRVELAYKNGLLVLDQSFYLNKEDFELEYEVENYQEGKHVFLELLNQFQIPERKTDNKIRRFYHQKYKQQNLMDI
ncbi:CYTH domain-containing protein [Neobacillus sp. NPDC058068]|uniref:CYTH domain-containing protein n=1 Tax=Neobacillus sp. NPDC058068 TaxID=3346325 RepID=UPI0036DDCDD3